MATPGNGFWERVVIIAGFSFTTLMVGMAYKTNADKIDETKCQLDKVCDNTTSQLEKIKEQLHLLDKKIDKLMMRKADKNES